MYERDKVFFTAGDIVQFKHEIGDKPLMVVQKVEKTTIKSEGASVLLGIQCMWFSKDFNWR